MKQCDLTKNLVFFLTIIITLCCSLIPSSWAFDDAMSGCTDKSFKGYYVFTQAGFMIVPDWMTELEQPVTMGSIGFIIADGKKQISGWEKVRLGENTINAPFKGTYKLEKNCTGTAWITAYPETDDGPLPPLNMVLSIVINGCMGDEVHLLTTSVDDMVPLAIVGTARRHTDD